MIDIDKIKNIVYTNKEYYFKYEEESYSISYCGLIYKRLEGDDIPTPLWDLMSWSLQNDYMWLYHYIEYLHED